tara:strand:+ start:6427 stop:7287 length:861 start_codon:yes stop_codon:yes gene_type:complete
LKGMPIIFFNFGNPDFLDVALKQAKYTNPNSDIYLIGDDGNRKDYVKHIHYSELMDIEAIEFSNNYINLSTNNEVYEKICFLRWFLIRNLVKRENIDRFFCTDSDVLLFCDITEQAENFKNYRYTLTHNVSAGISYINDVECLDQYCEFVNGVYNKQKHGGALLIRDNVSSKFKYYYDKFAGVFEIRKQNFLPGGVCDMTFWAELRLMDNPGLVGETSAIIDGSTFDHNINARDSYEWKDGLKAFQWKEDVPYCRNLWLQQDIKFNCIHFQGSHRKGLLKEYATYG